MGALSAMTFAIGRRFVIADGVERWKDADAEQVAAALAGVDPESLTVAFFAREEGRCKVPAALVKAVEAAGGPIAEESQVKPRELPRWLSAARQGARARARQPGRPGADRPGRRPPAAAAARAREARARARPRRRRSASRRSQESCAGSSERKLWTLADALVAGDRKGATRALLELRQQGERLPGLLYNMVRRLRDALAIAEALAAGQPPAQIKKGLRMPGFAADRLIADAGRRDVEAYRRALVLMADLEAREPRPRRRRAGREHRRGADGHRRRELSSRSEER